MLRVNRLRLDTGMRYKRRNRQQMSDFSARIHRSVQPYMQHIASDRLAHTGNCTQAVPPALR
ncbi:hypothetical protein [Xanthomonas campestris]|uniref:hypothetical protein n=1 Tax=Xanthomonas campestris TaxID=339 RepID=UPI0023794A47|nr:hypothetical protein [Xanthomonas campestris]WDL20034.1 hypothetical protein JH285_15360 [Xanthomonas campestris pv. campestris]WDL24114.1 hypothetical protein JH268_15370 [Xanthomonas campestris pv. campestris]WDL28200.1 hypothetical protein JH276_06435 [Xanthomonas campestris pv. campestris]WDL32290.1 hypothetical protein JH297_15395 [Xanthomonas campestris pv. campestris]WDL36390.1 hypothetical protein JH255_06460 [Xanthomonas campestris pv. campestris]